VGETSANAPGTSLRLSVLGERLAVCRLDAGSAVPDWATTAPFSSITRTAGELSVVCPEERVPEGITCERGWRALMLEGPFEFGMIGLLSSVVGPLAESEVSVLAIATYETDYVLVQESQLDPATEALRERGHEIR
jgi:uncharacterized protein